MIATRMLYVCVAYADVHSYVYEWYIYRLYFVKTHMCASNITPAFKSHCDTQMPRDNADMQAQTRYTLGLDSRGGKTLHTRDMVGCQT